MTKLEKPKFRLNQFRDLFYLFNCGISRDISGYRPMKAESSISFMLPISSIPIWYRQLSSELVTQCARGMLASCKHISKLSGWVVTVLALPSGSSTFKPRSWQLVKAIGELSGPGKIVYDWKYKNGQKIIHRVGRAKPHKGNAELSDIVPEPG